MKTMTCQQLDGACQAQFHGHTFEEIEAQSKAHGKAMMEQQDAAHLQAMQSLMERNKTPQDWQQWYEEKKAMFNRL